MSWRIQSRSIIATNRFYTRVTNVGRFMPTSCNKQTIFCSDAEWVDHVPAKRVSLAPGRSPRDVHRSSAVPTLLGPSPSHLREKRNVTGRSGRGIAARPSISVQRPFRIDSESIYHRARVARNQLFRVELMITALRHNDGGRPMRSAWKSQSDFTSARQ